jgi:membrane protease YdiL (CAAX protease family)
VSESARSPHLPSWLPAASAAETTSLARALFFVGLVYAVAVSPFIGGIRGIPVAVGWLLLPLLWASVAAGGWAGLGLRPGRPLKSWLIALGGAGAAGAVTATLLLAVGSRVPHLLEFVAVIPHLHRDTVAGNIVLFVALIPVAHVVHELFYRGFLQQRLAERLGVAPAILLGALAYAWTHVFVYASADYAAGAAALAPAGSGTAAATEATLIAVTVFAFVESIGAGLALHLTRNLFAAVAFRAVNLIIVALAVFARHGLL